jgi:hypothetical protein
MSEEPPEDSVDIKESAGDVIKDRDVIKELLPVGEENVDAHRRQIAMELLAIFKVVILVEVGGCFLLMLTCLTLIGFKLIEPATAVQLIKDGVVPLFTSASNLATALFGQLLAFVLGFYFGGQIKGK